MVEYIGETVIEILGLDDSMYQDVLDNMTEEEMEYACEVNREREEEYRRLFAAQQSVIANANAAYAEESGSGDLRGEQEGSSSSGSSNGAESASIAATPISEDVDPGSGVVMTAVNIGQIVVDGVDGSEP